MLQRKVKALLKNYSQVFANMDFLKNDLGNDFEQVIMNHKNKHRQMYRGRTKCSAITKVNSDFFFFL